MRCCWVWTHDSHQNVSFFTHISYHKERGPNRLYIYEHSKDIIIIEKRKVIIILLLLFLLGLISFFAFRCWKQCVLLHIMIQSLSYDVHLQVEDLFLVTKMVRLIQTVYFVRYIISFLYMAYFYRYTLQAWFQWSFFLKKYTEKWRYLNRLTHLPHLLLTVLHFRN